MARPDIAKEIGSHLPFSIFFTAAGIILAALLTYAGILLGVYPQGLVSCGDEEHATCAHADHGHGEENHEEGETGGDEHADAASETIESDARFAAASLMLFHIFHPVHLLLSAMATTAMFYRYEQRLVKASIVGLVGSLGVCGVSDIFMPFVGGQFLAVQDLHFHWCVLEHPQMVFPFAALGIISGLIAAGTVDRSTLISHSAHIFISSTASLFYLISFGLTGWFTESLLGPVFLLVILCVTIPCCLSDILFPLIIVSKDGTPPPCCGHSHD